MTAYMKKLGLPELKEIKVSNYERQMTGLAVLVLFFRGLTRKDW